MLVLNPKLRSTVPSAPTNAAALAIPSPFAGANPGVTFGGNFRGHYLQVILKYKFSRHLSGHLWSEFLFPGNYYVSRNVVDFLRAEVLFTF